MVATRIHLAAITGGRHVPSARFRVRQYVPLLKANGIHAVEFTARLGSYPPPTHRWIRPYWALATLSQRVPQLIATHGFQVTLLQRELLSTVFTLERLTRRPRILDVDDAIWLNRPGHARKLARACDAVICGNRFLAETFRRWNAAVHILPTAVDANRFCPLKGFNRSGPQIIVWSGTRSGHGYLLGIESAIANVLRAHTDARLRVISDTPPLLRRIDKRQYEYIPWSPGTEVAALQSADIGIMPLTDDPWARGKCSFKMLTYMACGLPVVVSPVGMNQDILESAAVGLSATTRNQWTEALDHLLRNPDHGREMGISGRLAALERFSLELVGARLAAIIQSFG